MRFTRDQYEQAILALQSAMQQLEPDGECCSVCGDSGHQAWECHFNPLYIMHICLSIHKSAQQLHHCLHQLCGYDCNVEIYKPLADAMNKVLTYCEAQPANDAN